MPCCFISPYLRLIKIQIVSVFMLGCRKICVPRLHSICSRQAEQGSQHRKSYLEELTGREARLGLGHTRRLRRSCHLARECQQPVREDLFSSLWLKLKQNIPKIHQVQRAEEKIHDGAQYNKHFIIAMLFGRAVSQGSAIITAFRTSVWVKCMHSSHWHHHPCW